MPSERPVLTANYFDGRSSRRHAATLGIHGDSLWVEGTFGRRVEALVTLEIGEPMDGAPRTIRFADGAFCEVSDQPALGTLLAAAGIGESAVVQAQARWHWALAALAGTVVVLAAAYLWALPWLARTLAPAIPDSFTRSLSAAALDALDARLLRPSQLPPARQQAIAGQVAALDHGALPPHRLLFRAAPSLGANAFALPNGDVVVFDELAALASDDGDIAAVIAHELGHVDRRHGMRQLIQSTIVSFVAGAYFGDISTAAASLGALLLESRYSREFEREADAYAARVLLAAGRSVEPLARMLERLEAAHGGGRDANRASHAAPSVLTSHPDTAERIAALRAIAGR